MHTHTVGTRTHLEGFTEFAASKYAEIQHKYIHTAQKIFTAKKARASTRYIYIYICTYTHTHTHVCVSGKIRIQTHTHTHTHRGFRLTVYELKRRGSLSGVRTEQHIVHGDMR